MPAVQSATPDIFIKAEQLDFEIVDVRTDLPAFADTGTADLILRLKKSTSTSTLAGGSVSGTTITLTVSTVGLAPGLYDGEWIITGTGAEVSRVPVGTYLLVEVVEPL